jgi:hypothetical protein
MMLRELDDRIVPKQSAVQAEGDKPSNIGAGKAVGISRDPDLAPSVLSDGTTVITRLARSHAFAIGVLNACRHFRRVYANAWCRNGWPVCKYKMR